MAKAVVNDPLTDDSEGEYEVTPKQRGDGVQLNMTVQIGRDGNASTTRLSMQQNPKPLSNESASGMSNKRKAIESDPPTRKQPTRKIKPMKASDPPPHTRPSAGKRANLKKSKTDEPQAEGSETFKKIKIEEPEAATQEQTPSAIAVSISGPVKLAEHTGWHHAMKQYRSNSKYTPSLVRDRC